MSDEPTNILGVTEIELVRGACLGTCPVFRFSAAASGFYRYEGTRYVEPLGERKGRFPSYLFTRLAELCGHLRILELDDVYPSHLDDAAGTYLTVRHTGGVKVVNSEGYPCPVQLWAFAIVIEHAMREAFAVQDRRRRR